MTIAMTTQSSFREGETAFAQSYDLERGTVLRMVGEDGFAQPFSDAVITQVSGETVMLMRPHARGIERFSCTKDRFLGVHSGWRVVMTERGNVAKGYLDT